MSFLIAVGIFFGVWLLAITGCFMLVRVCELRDLLKSMSFGRAFRQTDSPDGFEEKSVEQVKKQLDAQEFSRASAPDEHIESHTEGLAEEVLYEDK